MISFKKFTNIFIILCILILSVIAAFNYWMDPACIFDNKKVDLAVDYLRKGYYVAGLTNFDERIFQKRFILSSKEKPETIVFGSSRAMGIHKDLGTEKNHFANYSVSAANFNDDIALLNIYVDKYKDLPSKIILAVEPWDLNKNHGDTRWKSLELEYYAGLKLIDFENEEIKPYNYWGYTFEKIKTLVSISYLRKSIKEFTNNNTMPYITYSKYIKADVIRPDGSRKYGDTINNISLEKVNKIAKDYIYANKIPQLENFKELDLIEVKKFEALIKYLNGNKVEVILYFPPYHPIVYNYFQKNKKYFNVLEAEKYFMKFAVKEKLKIIGSYNPKLCNLTESDFFDGRHLKSKGYDKLFKNNF